MSGTGVVGHVSLVHNTPATRFAAAIGGFMRLDFLRDGRVRLGVITVESDRPATEAYSAFLREDS